MKNKAFGPRSPKQLGHPVFFLLSFSLSLPLPLFFRLIPWSTGAPSVHLSARVFNTLTRRRSASSLPRETERAPVACVNRATSCLEVLLVLYVNQGISASFSPLFSYLQHSYLSLSKSIAITDAISPSCFPGSGRGWTLAFPYFLQFKSELGNKEFMI